MGFEIEFHPVGDATRAGDAITIRYGEPDAYKIVVVDGGTDDTGKLVVAHIKRHYGRDAVVSDVISTHPDTDHSCGLRAVLDDLPVERLWVHGLWHHAAEILPLFAKKNWTAERLASAIRKEYSVIEELISKAHAQGAEVYQPFKGATIGPFTVLAPTKWAYQHLIPQFRKTPEPDEALLKEQRIWLSPKKGLAALIDRVVEAVSEMVAETWEGERLRDGGVTAAENESSVVLYGQFDTASVLLTADAGVAALGWAHANAQELGIDLTACRLVQVPHHGSRRNVGPTILNKVLGPILPKDTPERRMAIVSVPKDDERHPRRIVMNAFRRRGLGVRKTQGTRYRYYSDMPQRDEEVVARPFDFFSQVENYS
jgi:beta-lactamase superfamily II metal-dependent hydrolase